MSLCAERRRLFDWMGAAICLLVTGGCDGVQEDRHIAFTQSGDQVAFQHGSDGIFVADPHSGELRKVFDPDPSIVAVSTPLWSDDETQAIFTTARAAERPGVPPKTASSKNVATQTAGGQAPPISAPTAWEDAPTGRLFFPQAIVYTCWLVERSAEGTMSKPVSLFEAHCNHSGYVAANLAVHWDSKQKKILFVDRDTPVSHEVHSFDIATKRAARLFPPAGQMAPVHVAADFLPDGKHVVCVAMGTPETVAQAVGNSPSKRQPPNLSGIWIGSTDGSSWWHVNEAAHVERDNVLQGLSNLVSQRPAFTKDGSRFAFLREETTPKDSKLQSTLFRVRLADRKVEKIFKTAGEIHDLRWSPDGSRLGFLVADPMPSLKIIDAEGHAQEVLTDHFVHEFAGWNTAGDKFVCVAIDKMPPNWPAPTTSPGWEPLLVPDPLARDTVFVVDRQGIAHAAVSGLRFTFPQWSPKRDQLSMWGTFSPSHFALTTEMGGGLGLRQGDPAAIVDVSTSGIRWLAINGDEMAQVGHYYLLKHDAAQAREWYRKADKQLPKLEPLRPADLLHGLSGTAAHV